jgi:phenylalanyl-tRNA synthetase beta chain
VKASYNWLRSLLPGLDASPGELAARLTGAGLEVEAVEEYGAASKAVLIAEVRRVEPHPKRSQLTLVTVDRGQGEQTVVCGAPNVPPPGNKVVLAPLGAELPAVGLTVGKRAIGGVDSEGMLCSEQELGLLAGGGKGEGILVLGALQVATGASFAKALPAAHDFVFEISVTPNRPDALGHVGLARELAALYRLPFEAPSADSPARIAAGPPVNQIASVDIADVERCPHYGAAVVVEVQSGPSPAWLRYRLESLGVRAINSVVDVTNLVLLEFGHPIHAFDLDRLPRGRVLVRRAQRGERMTTIDHVERELSDDDLLITDGERPIALAGVMGGADSEIGADTRRVLIECAYFTPRGIRRTSRRHGLHSEASHRFERGVDPEAVPDVLAHTASLVTRLCGGAAVPGTILAGVAPAPHRRVRLRIDRMNALLGIVVDEGAAADILTRLGCVVARAKDRELEVTVPSFRPDLAIEEDLIEEVMRVHGINELPATTRRVLPATGRSAVGIEDRARVAAAGLGLSEALTYGFVSRAELAAVSAPAASVVLKNPLSEERSVMRTSLLPGLLEALGRARRHGVSEVGLFTVGHTYLAANSGALPHERLELAAVLAGTRTSGLDKPQPVDVYDAKGIALELVERVTLRHAEVRRSEAAHLHPRARGEVVLDGGQVGTFGPLHPDVVDALDLGGPCMVVEIDLEALEGAGRSTPQYRPIPTLPAVDRDLALVVKDEVEAGELGAAIRDAAGELCESVELFDVFRGQGVPDAHRSLAFHLTFRDPRSATHPDQARTLTDEEVDARTAAVIDRVKERFGAVVRGA